MKAECCLRPLPILTIDLNCHSRAVNVVVASLTADGVLHQLTCTSIPIDIVLWLGPWP